jgi:hypothetical protein
MPFITGMLMSAMTISDGFPVAREARFPVIRRVDGREIVERSSCVSRIARVFDDQGFQRAE